MAKPDKRKTVAPSRTHLFIITGVSTSNLDQVSRTLDEIKGKLQADEIWLTGKTGSGDSIKSYADAHAQLKDSAHKYTAVLPATRLDDLPGIQHAMRTGGKLEANAVYLPDRGANKDQKRSVLHRCGLFLSRLVGLQEVNGLDSGSIVMNTQTLFEKGLMLESPTLLDHSAYRLGGLAVLNGLQQVSMPYRSESKAGFSYFKAILASFQDRINWFILKPLSDLKTVKMGDLKNGNNGLYRLLFATFALLSLVILPMISFDFGITWDEHEDRKYFTEVISYFQTGGEDTRALDTGRKLHDHLVNYGPFVNLTCAFAEEYLSPFDTYETRHLVLSLFAFIGLLFTALLARKAGSWRTAVIVLLVMMLTPAFLGHSANNQKDMPFMAFYIASLFYIVRFTMEMPHVRTKTYVMTGLMMGILFSIRAGGLIVFPYLVLFVGLKWLLNFKSHAHAGKSFFQYVYKGLIPMAMAYIIGVILWPAALQDPLGHPLEALRNFEKFSLVHVYEIFEGARFYMKDFPWYYAIKMMGITLPLFVLAGLMMFAICYFFLRKQFNKILILIIGFSVVFPLAYIAYKDSALYNSWRHVLFVMPGILILSGIGWDMLMAAKARLLNGIALVLLLGGMGWTAKWIVQNHPYEYMYYNELVGGVKGAFGNYELDYWCQTPKEAMQWLLDEEGLKDKKATVVSNNEVYSIIYYADKNQTNGKELRSIERQVADIDDDIDRLGHYKKEGLINEAEYNLEVEALKKEADPLRQKIRDMKKVNVLWARESQWNYDYWDYAIWTNRTLSPTLIKKGYFPPKGTIHTIDVDGVPIAAIVKRDNQYMADAHACKKRNQLDSAEMYLKMYLEYDSLEEEAYRTLAEIQVMKSNWSEAIRYADKSLNLVPESFYSHNFKGIAYLRLGQLTEAEQSFKEVIKFKPNFSAGHDGLGDVAYSQRDFNNAIKHYQTALSFAGNNYFIYYKMGACYLEMNDLNNAANHFNASIQTNGNFAASYKGMYDVLIKAGQADRAQEYLIKYQQLGGR